MCQFFSFVTKGSKKYYFNWDQRQALIKDNPDDLKPDSHTSICHYHKLDVDKVNKYEYNPLTEEFTIDQVNIKDDRARAKKWVKQLDFKTVVEPLKIQPIINPFNLPKVEKITPEHEMLLKQWVSVRASINASVKASVRHSVWVSAGNSIRALVGNSVKVSVRNSVWVLVRHSVRDSISASVGNSVWDSINASVGNSVKNSVWAFTSDFIKCDKWLYIDHEPGENPFQSCIDLWKQGLVPSFDGTSWRLHSGPKAEIVYTVKF